MTLYEEVRAFLKECDLAGANYQSLCECIERAGWLMLSAVATGHMSLARCLGNVRDQLNAEKRRASMSGVS